MQHVVSIFNKCRNVKHVATFLLIFAVMIWCKYFVETHHSDTRSTINFCTRINKSTMFLTKNERMSAGKARCAIMRSGVLHWNVAEPRKCGQMAALSLCRGCWKLKQVNLLEMTQKVVSVIEMAFLYASRYSIVLLRQKMRLNSQHKMHPARFVWGNDLYQVGRFIFTRLLCLPMYRSFFPTRMVP